MKHIPCELCATRNLGLFCQLTVADQAMCNQHKTTNIYRTGQVLFYEGNRPVGVYCIFSGKVKLYKTGAGGRLQIVRLAGQGDLLGYRSLIADETYLATAEVLEEATICFIDKSTFFELLSRNRTLSMAMMQKIARELGEAETHVVDVVQKSTRERLAGLLLTLKETYGQDGPQGAEIGIELSREEMAEMIGTTQETVIRILSEMKSNGVIDVDGRVITIRKASSLKSLLSDSNGSNRS